MGKSASEYVNGGKFDLSDPEVAERYRMETGFLPAQKASLTEAFDILDSERTTLSYRIDAGIKRIARLRNDLAEAEEHLTALHAREDSVIAAFDVLSAAGQPT